MDNFPNLMSVRKGKISKKTKNSNRMSAKDRAKTYRLYTVNISEYEYNVVPSSKRSKS